MKKYRSLLSLGLLILQFSLYSQEIFMHQKSIGIRYIDFLQQFIKKNDIDTELTQEVEALFSPDIKKIINSQVICTTRNNLLKQMTDIKATYAPHSVTLLEHLQAPGHKDIIRWEISYTQDNTSETVITILTYTDNNVITEINEVFGEKNMYEWKP